MKETKKQNLWIKKLRKNKYLPFILLFITIAFIHIFMKNIGDDGYFKSINFHELIIRYKSWSSRVVIEFFLIIIAKQNINIWKIIHIIVHSN